MKRIIIGLIILVLNFTAWGQSNAYIEVVYLKNGSIIRGTIIEQIPNVKLKIETRDGNVFVYTYEEIEKITKEIVPTQDQKEDSDVNRRNQNKNEGGYMRSGYFNATELLISSGFGEAKNNGYSNFKNNSRFYGFRTSHGYQASPHFAFGIGTGLIIGNYDNYIPIFIDMRFPLGKNKFRATFNIAGGTILKETGNYFVNPSIGMKIYLSKRSSFNLNFGTYTRPITVNKQVPVPYGYAAAYKNLNYVINDFLLTIGFSF
jgi:hypothetical protein